MGFRLTVEMKPHEGFKIKSTKRQMEKKYLPEQLTSERIHLKKHETHLAEKMFQYVLEDKERLSQFLPWPKFINSIQDEINFINRCNESWIDKSGAHYGIYRNSDTEYMGNISSFSFNWENASCEIVYWILGKFEKNGYMSEAVKLIEKTLFETGFNRIVIRFDPQNFRSGSIPKRLGYSFEGILREAVVVDNTFRNLEVYSKLKCEFDNEQEL